MWWCSGQQFARQSTVTFASISPNPGPQRPRLAHVYFVTLAQRWKTSLPRIKARESAYGDWRVPREARRPRELRVDQGLNDRRC